MLSRASAIERLGGIWLCHFWLKEGGKQAQHEAKDELYTRTIYSVHPTLHTSVIRGSCGGEW